MSAATRSQAWQAAGASALESDPLAAWVDGAADVLATVASSGCFSHMTCGGGAGEYSCAVTSGTAGVRCAPDPSEGGVRCSCIEPPFGVVATLAQMPTTNAFYGALAMLCGATCPEPAGCMPTVSCYGGDRWSCDVHPPYERIAPSDAPSSVPAQQGLLSRRSRCRSRRCRRAT